MTFKSCPREKELRELISHGKWTAGAEIDSELRAHVADCRSCGDLVLVGEIFHNARAESAVTARLTAPGVLWWRAQLRRRNAAVESVTRPLLGAQIFALAFMLVAGLGFLVFEAVTSDSWRLWLHDLPQNAALDWNNLLASATANPAWTWMILGPALALLGGVAVYMAAERQ
jgi:hypothetical protein